MTEALRINDVTVIPVALDDAGYMQHLHPEYRLRSPRWHSAPLN
ncbi:hypothetical protein ACIA8E_33885 [Streptomyces sp. NPDC051664]